MADKELEKWVKETELMRASLYWLSQHPEITPFASLFGKYAAGRVMDACLGPQHSQKLQMYLSFLGVRMQPVSLQKVCAYALSAAYQEALRNPVRSLHLAMKSVHLISEAVDRLAQLPEDLEKEHVRLASALFENMSRADDNWLLQEALGIYKGPLISEWLHVGLPEILQEMHEGTRHTKEEILALVRQVYSKWRTWGQTHRQPLATAKRKAAEQMLTDAQHSDSLFIAHAGPRRG